ncbi:MAG: FHA domain-containing protein [Solirubrobacteraceae bacterium]
MPSLATPRGLAATCQSSIGEGPVDRPRSTPHYLGRGLNADIRIEDSQVSRRHAIIVQRGDGIRVLEDRSRNGTFVNGREVTVGLVDDGGRAPSGPHVFRIVEARRRSGPDRCGASRSPPSAAGASRCLCRRGFPPTLRSSANSRSRPNHAVPRHIRGHRGRGP